MSTKDEVPALVPRAIGMSIPRTEDTRFLTGRGCYVADVTLPGMLHVALVRSTCAHARVVSVDVKRARAADGVHLVWTGGDTTPLTAGVAAGLQIEGMQATVQPLLADGVVRYVGEPVAAVVAESVHSAEDAAAVVEVEYEPLPAVLDAEAALTDGSPLANETLTGNVILRLGRNLGDVDATAGAAAFTVGGRFVTSRCSAQPIETRGCLASYEWTTNDLTLWTGTQIPHFLRSMIAIYLGFPEHNLEVVTPDVGGAFGQKAHLFPEEMLVCLLAKELRRPVRWIEDRAENLVAATHAKEQVHDMELAVAADGRLLSITDRVLGDGGAYNSFPWTPTVEGLVGLSTITGVYRIPAARDEVTLVATNKCPVGAYRGVGWTAPQIAREGLLDEAARRLGISPFEMRRRNVIHTDDLPYRSPTGLTFYEGSFLETVDTLERAVDYAAFVERQRAERERGRHLGLGISIFNEINGVGTRACADMRLPITTHDTSTIRVEPTGKVLVTTSLVSQGQGHATTFAQVAADALGVPVGDVVVRAGTTNQTYGLGTWGSRAAVIGSGSVLRAANVVREKLLSLAGHLLEAAPEDLVMDNGMIHVAGVPAKAIPFGEVAGAAYFAEVTHPPGFDPTLEATCTYDPRHSPLANGGHAVLVDVDVETGLVRVERVWAVEDCGVMINPTIVEGQIHGGVAQAIGQVLFEEIIYDDAGQVQTATLADYLVPSPCEIPNVEVIHLQTPSPFTPGGIKGMGESAMISAPAAVVNAVNDALSPFGIVIRKVPITPMAIFEALRT